MALAEYEQQRAARALGGIPAEKVAAVALAMRAYDVGAPGPKTWRELAAVALVAAQLFEEESSAGLAALRSDAVLRAVAQGR